jgi:hypothetical protein
LEKQKKIKKEVSIVDVLVKIRARHLPNTNSEALLLQPMCFVNGRDDTVTQYV